MVRITTAVITKYTLHPPPLPSNMKEHNVFHASVKLILQHYRSVCVCVRVSPSLTLSVHFSLCCNVSGAVCHSISTVSLMSRQPVRVRDLRKGKVCGLCGGWGWVGEGVAASLRIKVLITHPPHQHQHRQASTPLRILLAGSDLACRLSGEEKSATQQLG